MLAEMRDKGEGFYPFANRMSQTHKRYFDIAPLSTTRLKMFEESVVESHARQKQIEAADTMSFAEFMRWYESQ
jgi:glutamate--cysteine ligase